MNTFSIVLLLMEGLTLGVIFYGGLWLTVRSLPTARHPVWLTMGSFWIRTLVVLAGFVFVSRGSWQNALLCLVGFAIGRLAVSKYLALGQARSRCL